MTSYHGYLGHHSEPSTETPLGRRATVVALANQKGGVGKSTTTINLGAGLALQGERVLLVDIDPQANTTSGLGIDRERLERTIYDVLVEDIPVEDVIEPTSMRDLFVLPSTIELAGAEIELVSMLARETRLRNAIDKVARRVRLHPGRLPAVARAAQHQRAHRRRRGSDPDPVRVLRPRGRRSADAEHRPRPPAAQP